MEASGHVSDMMIRHLQYVLISSSLYFVIFLMYFHLYNDHGLANVASLQIHMIITTVSPPLGYSYNGWLFSYCSI